MEFVEGGVRRSFGRVVEARSSNCDVCQVPRYQAVILSNLRFGHRHRHVLDASKCFMPHFHLLLHCTII
jgi:hypothetical protein